MCRHLLLLLVFLDGQFSLQVQMQFWLEIWGNIFLRPRVVQYIAELCNQILIYFSKDEGPLGDFVDVSHLKYKERCAKG